MAFLGNTVRLGIFKKHNNWVINVEDFKAKIFVTVGRVKGQLVQTAKAKPPLFVIAVKINLVIRQQSMSMLLMIKRRTSSFPTKVQKFVRVDPVPTTFKKNIKM